MSDMENEGLGNVLEDEKDTVEVDLASVGLVEKGNGMERQIQMFEQRINDLEDEKEKLMRRISMSVGDAKLALESSDQTLRDVRNVKRDIEKFIQESGDRIENLRGQLEEGISRLSDISRIDGRLESLESKIKIDVEDSLRSIRENMAGEQQKSINGLQDNLELLKIELDQKLAGTENGMVNLKGILVENLSGFEAKFGNFREDMADRVERIEKAIQESLKTSVDDMEGNLKDLAQDAGRLNEEFKRLSEVNADLLDQIDTVKSDVNSRLNDASESIQGLETALDLLRADMDRRADVQEERLNETSGKLESMLEKRIGAVDEQILNLEIAGEEINKKLRAQDEKLNKVMDEKFEDLERRLEDLKATVESDIMQSLEPLRREFGKISGDLDTRLQPFREEIDAVMALLNSEIEKMGMGWQKLEKAVADSEGASEVAEKARKNLADMEREIGDSVARVGEMIATINENSYKTESNLEKINLTIKLIDEVREKVRSAHVPAESRNETVPEFDMTDILTESEISGEPDLTDLGFELDDLLKVMVKHTASDLHLKAGSVPTARLNGELITVGKDIIDAFDCRKLILSAMTPQQRRQLNRKREVDFAYSTSSARFRVNAFVQQQTLSASFRFLRTDIPDLDELKAPDVVKKMCASDGGLILVTGPAGSGKTTTVAGMIDYINVMLKKHVVTIENPIEFVHVDKGGLVTQREIGSDTPSCYSALVNALRQDPDVIFIADMREPQVIMQAVTSAETGNLIIATMNTPNAVQAIKRLMDAFHGENKKHFKVLLANTLRGVISQKLVKKADETGRMACFEILKVTPAVSNLILEEKPKEIYQQIFEGNLDGMQTLSQSLSRLVEDKVITREEALANSGNPRELRQILDGLALDGAEEEEDSLMNWL